ncbi:alkyl hydroperoxide reductase AhpD [Actinorhabdospora filicis]|uniref:Alkyl hydroperoxide reductase AhpD n=1 Tax=Actinorhabdospora filicis TaxID=1785913 RepID=A0A9W6SLU0_9ACTN|nr:carboxymuconolactone decarboxylase family protein [Actinorhabdospora filicis]GLZ78358.1 alkyl hydroperoxide reductase AhpD [Actinorhabdospora filicis]
MSTERMPNPAALVPAAMQGLMGVIKAVNNGGLDPKLLGLTHLRASQINNCAPCVSSGAKQSRQHGATDDQVDAVAAWRETPYFSDAERSALALTEAVTRMADQPDAVPDTVWDTAAKHFDQEELAVLLLNIAVTNLFNRLNAPTRQQAGGKW